MISIKQCFITLCTLVLSTSLFGAGDPTFGAGGDQKILAFIRIQEQKKEEARRQAEQRERDRRQAEQRAQQQRNDAARRAAEERQRAAQMRRK